MNKIEIAIVNGELYRKITPEDALNQEPKKGNRAVVVVDRGWIFAGDVTEANGRIRLDRAVWLFSWEKIGFNGVIDNPEKADIRPIDPVDIPAGAEIFRVPVSDHWGLA
jgi:hypothetical protein